MLDFTPIITIIGHSPSGYQYSRSLQYLESYFLMAVAAGSIIASIDKDSYTANEGSVVIVPPQSVAGYRKCSVETEVIGVHFHLSLIDIPIRLQYWQHEDSNAGLAGLQVLTALHLPLPMSAWAAQATASSYLANESSFKAQRLFPVIWRPSRDIFDKAMTFLQELLYDIQHQISLFQLSASALLKQFLIEVLRHPGQDRSPSSTNRVSPRAIDFFRENLREGFSLQKVAHHIGYHPNYFAACFREETGLTPWSYYMLMRLAEARRMLREGNHTIAEIASTLGFCTSSYFTRIFRQYEGVTPSEYRRLQS